MRRTRRSVESAGDIGRLRERLDAWRNRPERGRRVPEEFWQEALGLCQAHSVSSVAKTHGLNYTALKERYQPLIPPSSGCREKCNKPDEVRRMGEKCGEFRGEREAGYDKFAEKRVIGHPESDVTRRQYTEKENPSNNQTRLLDGPVFC